MTEEEILICVSALRATQRLLFACTLYLMGSNDGVTFANVTILPSLVYTGGAPYCGSQGNQRCGYVQISGQPSYSVYRAVSQNPNAYSAVITFLADAASLPPPALSSPPPAMSSPPPVGTPPPTVMSSVGPKFFVVEVKIFVFEMTEGHDRKDNRRRNFNFFSYPQSAPAAPTCLQTTTASVWRHKNTFIVPCNAACWDLKIKNKTV